MLRALYRCLLLLHPPAFRRRFGAEMLSIFDDAAESDGAGSLLLDGFFSVARQWVLRTGAWKVAAAVAGACVQVLAGGLIWPLITRPHGRARFALDTQGAQMLLLMMLT